MLVCLCTRACAHKAQKALPVDHGSHAGVLHWGGRLMALFENGLPHEMVRGSARLGFPFVYMPLFTCSLCIILCLCLFSHAPFLVPPAQALLTGT